MKPEGTGGQAMRSNVLRKLSSCANTRATEAAWRTPLLDWGKLKEICMIWLVRGAITKSR
jgi:hypothetical protein